MKNNSSTIMIKMVVYQFVFLLMHYAYDWFPSNLTKIFGGINESIFQHMKVAYFAYLVLSILEYILLRKKTIKTNEFIVSRIFATSFIPWTVFVYYFMAAAYYGEIDNIPVEIIYANIILLLASFTTITVERHIEKIFPGTAFKVVTAAMFVISLSYYIIFTVRLPWFDVFAVPPGW